MKAIIPAGGLGTRLLPVTKVIPKELLPVEGKPAIQWALEEAERAGLREFVVVISPTKGILRNYLTSMKKDHALMRHRGLDELEQLLRSVNITFVEQPAPLGLGDAVLRCREFVNNETFVLMLPDNVFDMSSRVLAELLAINRAYRRSCVALRQARGLDLKDGAVFAELSGECIYNVQRVLPKASMEGKATNLRPIGRYVLEPSAFDYLAQAGAEGELDDVPMLDGMARDGSLLGLLTAEEFCHIGTVRQERE